jgi:mRNA interferase MazF
MGVPAIREVVIVPFPCTDLSQTKVRPAVCLTDAHRGDWLFCQITSSPYGDATATSLSSTDFESGGLLSHSDARPLKLFTLHHSTVVRTVGKLNDAAFARIVTAIIDALRPGTTP